MSRCWMISDTHFGHEGVCKFLDSQGNKIRPFSCAEEMDEAIISRWNNVVGQKDSVYVLGDVAMKRKDISTIARCNGRKVLIRGNHDCADVITRCITKRGIVNYDEISLQDEVLSINPTTRTAEWKPIDSIIIKDYDGEMVCMDTVNLSFCLTPTHRFLISIDGELNYVPANSLPSLFSVPVTRNSGLPEYSVSDWEIIALGWLLTDAGLNRHKGTVRSVTFYQSKPEGVEAIEKMLNALSITYNKFERKTREHSDIKGRKCVCNYMPIEFKINVEDSKKLLGLLDDNDDKKLPKWVSLLSDRQFKVLLDTLIDGDGSWASNGLKQAAVLHGNKPLLEDILIQCMAHGARAFISVVREDEYRLNISFVYTDRMYQRKQQQIKGMLSAKNYSGKVWCISTEHTNFAVERNGKVFFTGNCFQMKDYTPFFDDIRGVHVMPARIGILSHVPLHPDSVTRFKLNIHGHLHERIIEDNMYFNVCCEKVNYTPISYDEIIEIWKKRTEDA